LFAVPLSNSVPAPALVRPTEPEMVAGIARPVEVPLSATFIVVGFPVRSRLPVSTPVATVVPRVLVATPVREPLSVKPAMMVTPVLPVREPPLAVRMGTGGVAGAFENWTRKKNADPPWAVTLTFAAPTFPRAPNADWILLAVVVADPVPA
jgi:hypothetical protein